MWGSFVKWLIVSYQAARIGYLPLCTQFPYQHAVEPYVFPGNVAGSVWHLEVFEKTLLLRNVAGIPKVYRHFI